MPVVAARMSRFISGSNRLHIGFFSDIDGTSELFGLAVRTPVLNPDNEKHFPAIEKLVLNLVGKALRRHFEYSGTGFGDKKHSELAINVISMAQKAQEENIRVPIN